VQVQVHRCRGAEVQRFRGSEVQSRIRGSEVLSCGSVGVQRCRGEEVKEVQKCIGAEVQRCWRLRRYLSACSFCMQMSKEVYRCA
jgi:hypothetical protein